MAKFFKDEPVEKKEETSLEELERISGAEVAELAGAFRERMKTENKRFTDVCDTEYWFCVCFTNRKQKEEFLDELGLDKDEKYLDGRELARKIKLRLKTKDMEFPKTQKFNKDYVELSK